MSHYIIFEVGPYQLDAKAWRKTFPPKKMEIRKSSAYI